MTKLTTRDTNLALHEGGPTPRGTPARYLADARRTGPKSLGVNP